MAWRGINANPDKVQGIHDLKDELYCKGDVRILLGKANFVGAFVPGMGDMTAPLYCLLKNDVPENWGDDVCGV
eukprot:COSAG01_NODE_1285_length_10901_cov_5.922514_6_plen_73_part_00